METRFFTGNHLLSIGHPYIIISAEEKATEFIAEKFIIFEAFDGQTVLKSRVKYPKTGYWTLEDFITAEVQICEDEIVNKILNKKYETQFSKLEYYADFSLRKSNWGIIGLLRDKFPTELNEIKETTYNELLKMRIELFQSIIVERNDF